MGNNSDHILSAEKMPAGARDNLIRGLESKRIKSARWNLAIFLGVGIAALAATIVAIMLFTDEFAQSGIHQYLSLILTDADAIFDFWQDFLIIFAESFPIAALIAALAAIVAFLYSIKIIFRNIKTAMAKVRLAK